MLLLSLRRGDAFFASCFTSEKIASAISSCKTISVTSFLFFFTRPMKLSDRRMLLITRAKSQGQTTALQVAQRSMNGVKKCWRTWATPANRKRFENLCLQILVLTKVSFNDFPLRYDSMDGSWNISFRCGWFWKRCHFPINIFLRLRKAGWHCVAKGNIFFFVLLSLFSWDLSLSLKLTSKRCFSKNSSGYPLIGEKEMTSRKSFAARYRRRYFLGGWNKSRKMRPLSAG